MLNSDATEAALGLLGLHSDTQTIPLKRKLPSLPVQPPADTEDISCICGFTYDDGFSIACDVCSRWCHAACFGIVEGGDVPEEWRCWVCGGGTIADEQRERAVKIQRKRLKAMKMRNNGASNAGGTGTANGVGEETSQRKPASRRKTSPNAEKKPRRASGMSVGDMFPPDVYPDPSTHARLLKVAKAWRGITALTPPVPVSAPPTTLYAGPSTSTSTTPPAPTSTSTSTSISIPTPTPTSTHRTTTPHTIPSNTLLAPYTATIRPTSAYLADPLNGYAHLGMGKPQVRLVGGGWCVGVDGRELGGDPGKARWARCGCWPNAVVRPVICRGARKRKKKGEGGHENGNRKETDETTLSFALFALRDLRADEEIVLGWEWDDGHAVHMLPALMESPGMFGCVSSFFFITHI
ncbi:hypothetical protein J3A83DRAFT_4087520 [Scleroderma citrinum]